MPHAIPSPRLRLAIAGAIGVLLAIALPAAAQAACPRTPTTKPFQVFSDLANYSLAPGGDFESGASGWSLNGARVASGNESYKVHGTGDSHSLAIGATGTATSPAFCVSIAQPTFRFFTRQTSGSWATMLVKLRWRDSSGAVNTTTVGSINGNTTWSATQVFALSSVLPLWQSGQTLSVQLLFDPEDYGGAWAIDDVYVDPYARG
jgi:hypothetical protein